MNLLDLPADHLKVLMLILDRLDDSQIEILHRWAKGEADFAKGAIVFYTDERGFDCKLYLTDEERPGVSI